MKKGIFISIRWLFLVALLASTEACASHESDKPAPPLTASRAASDATTRISIDTANAYVRSMGVETKMVREIVEKWDADTNAATSLEELKQIAIAEGSTLDVAVQHNKKATDLLDVVTTSFPTPCNKSASIVSAMANEDLAVEVEKKNLLVQSDLSSAAGLAQFRRASAPLKAREHAIVDTKNAYVESAAYKNACGPND